MDKKMYDLTAPQKSIWLTEQYYTNSNVNNICGTAIVSEILDLNLLKKAISNIIEKNDIFRLHFIENNGNLKQYFEKTESKPIEIIELDSKDDISTLEQKLLTKVFNIYEDLYEFKIFRVEKSNISGFMLNVHHIKADAITLGLCSKKIMQEYIALSNNENIETNEKSTYENYINSEIEYQNSKKYESDKLYWEEKFKEIPNIVTIPSNKKDSTEFSYKANRYNYLVDKEKMNKIIEFCANSKISVFNLFMGILSIYMYRVNNINDFVIGTPILNRTNFVEKNTLGMFINVAPLRVNVNDNSTILEFLSNIATDSMGLLRHQKYSYQSILENIRKTNPSIPNLYNIVLSYQITKANLESDIDYETRWAFNGTCLNDIDIHLFDLDNTGELNIAYDYNVDKYDEQDIVDLNTRLNYLIDQVLENSSVKIQDLEIATPEERDLILNVFNNTKVDYPSDKNIVELFEEQVKLHPDNIAVVFEDEKLTYRELNEKANLLAKYLIEKGLKSNDVIGILFDKSIEMIISILATLKASATYLPLDIQFPKERIEYIIQDSNLKFILSQNKFHITINSNKFIDFNLKNYTYNAYNTNNLSLTINENTPAYIMYTSGTTGNPKGAKVLHKNIIRLVKNTNYIQFTNQDIVLQIGTIAFDASTFEIWGALLNGGTLHLLKKEALLNTTLFSNYLNKNNITTILLTTSLFNKYSEINPKMFSKLKNLVTGGEAASAKHMNLVIKENPNLNLVNAYGPTENGVISSYFKVENSNNDFIPIGQPIANSTCYIVSPTGKLLPPGIPGELWVGGDGVGGGYQNRNTLNTEKFIDNPFQSGKIYKTGDMAAWNSNGILKFFGRIDTQVKIRGFRIELEEINNLLLKHKDIINCTTQIFEQDTEKKLVSYIISDNDITPSELRNYLATKLPVYMIPSYFIKIDNIPLTINGKVDRKALPLPTINTNKTILKPRNNIDKLVIKIIAELTQIKQTNIGISDSIFDLGMDSLSVMNFTNEIYEHLTIPITVKDVFENSIISELSDFINNTQRTHLNKTFSTKTQSVSYTSSRAQKRIFYTANMNPNLCVYNICGGIEFYKKLNFDKICSVFKILIQRHESFRTYFEIIDGELYQKILSNLELKIDFKKITVNQIDEYFKKFNTKFNLCEAPLLKIQVLYLNNNHTMLLINMHHIISDGTSMNILLNEFCQLYNNQELSKIKFNYKDFINYEQYYSGSDSYNKSKTFWLNEFSENIPILNLPTNSTRPATFTFNGKKTSKKINQTLTNSIKALANELNITPYMLLLSAYYILLYKYTGQTDIIVGTPTANRTIKEFSKIIGMFVNTLAIRKHINIESSFKEFSKELKEKCLNCFMYQNYPFDELVKELNLKRDLSRNPLFDTMFSYQNNEKKIINFNNAKLKHYLPDTGISKFDLSLEIISEKNEFKIIAEYCINLFEDKFIDNLLTHYINILKTIVKKPNIKLKNICILSNTEKNTIKSFNITDLDIPKRNTLINRFQNIVKKYPNHIAVEFNTKKITYKKLDKLSNFLAQELIQNGITKGNVIGVCLNKSLELIVSIFAILKIGAIYMPMYTNYPQERLEYMIENSQASILITNSGFEKNTNLNIKKIIINNINDLHNKNIINTVKIDYYDIAYIIYTSGSTGKPKGVQIKHSNLLNFIYAFNKYYKNKINSNDIFLSSTNISFDVSIWEIFLPLLNGSKLILYNEEIISDIVNYSNYILDNKITGLYIPPNILNDVFVLLQNKKVYIEKLLVGVEAIKKSTLNKYYELNPKMLIVNAYGPTETTICATALNYNKDYTDDTFVSIGKPLYNNNIYILDEALNLMPIGIPGEIYIAGAGVGKGYINNPSANQKSFIKNTLDKSSKYLYKTGDLAKWNEDGTINFIGRKDNQIKISGYRIELGEIEYKINQFPSIKKCLTIIKEFENNKILVSYIIAEKKISTTDLLAYLKKSIPTYMIPKFIIQIETFPLTSNGKIDKTKLPEPIITLPDNYEPPTNEIERTLCNIWSTLFNIKKIGISDNFFELGGDSLTAIKLQTESLKYGLNLSYSNIFTHPTIKELSKGNITNEKIYTINPNYNYTKFEKYLNINNKNNITKNYRKYSPKNILLFGATGFLGAHLLDSFLSNTDANIYCLVRKKGTEDIQTRLKNTLNYYFNDKYDTYFENRIKIINGDITKNNFDIHENLYNSIGKKIDCVINSAAFVKHFGNYNTFKSVNIDGTKNIIHFCKKYKIKLYHISTISVSGMENQNSLKQEKHFAENNLFINQDLNNAYVYTKFEAEKLILEEMNNNLNACIFRLGNIVNRHSDGKFQINFSENAFINRIKSILNLKVIPKKLLEHHLEFSPVDTVSEAIRTIICSQNNFTIFHIFNPNILKISKFVEYVNQLGFNLKKVSDQTFSKKIDIFLNDNNKKQKISGLIQYLNKNKEIDINFKTLPIQDFSLQFLNTLDFHWPNIDYNYIKLFIKFFKDIDYIE